VLSQSDNIVLWKVDNAEEYDGHSQSLGLWQSNQWKIPRSSRQAGFDAACLFEDHGKNIFRVVQVTCGARHDLRMDVLKDLAQKFSDYRT
jgi:hypothetical protein